VKEDRMPRITVRIPEEMQEKIDEIVEDGPYTNTSELFRSGVRQLPEWAEAVADGGGEES